MDLAFKDVENQQKLKGSYTFAQKRKSLKECDKIDQKNLKKNFKTCKIKNKSQNIHCSIKTRWNPQ